MADLGGDPGRAGASVHELAHARLAETHARGGLRARAALQIAERGGFAFARAEPSAQPLHQLAQARAIVELSGEISLGRRGVGRAGLHAVVTFVGQWIGEAAKARAVLVDCAPVGHEREPSLGVGDLGAAFEHGCVEPVPGLGVAGVEVGGVERDAGGAQARANACEDAGAHPLELLAQEPFGAVATHGERTHTVEDCEPGESVRSGMPLFAQSLVRMHVDLKILMLAAAPMPHREDRFTHRGGPLMSRLNWTYERDRLDL